MESKDIKMKLNIIVLFIAILPLISCNNETNEATPDEDPRRGRFYKSEKIGFFTEQMNLTEKEAQRFWPVYNKYEQKRDSLWRARRHFMMDYKQNNLDIQNSSEALNHFLSFGRQMEDLKANFVNDLQSFLSDEKILHMLYTEHEFKFFMLNRIRGRHGRGPGQGRGIGRGRGRMESPNP